MAVPANYPQGGFNTTNLTAAGSTLIKTGPGILGGLSINTAGTGASVTLFDNTAASGKKLGTFSANAQGGPVLPQAGLSFAIGLFAVVAGAPAPDVTAAWF
jgi:hypothetical protein